LNDPLSNNMSIILQARKLCLGGKPQEALLLLDKARGQITEPSILIEIANVLDDMNLSQSAETVLAEGLHKFADNPAMAIAAANHYYKQNQPEKGLKITATFVASTSCTNELLLTHAHLLKANGQYEEASLYYEKVLASAPQNSIALSSLGGIALDLRDYVTALEYYRAAHAAEPSNPHIETQLAYAEFRSGDLKNGWLHYEARFGNKSSAGIAQARPHTYPLWDGKTLTKGKLLVWCEQAAGEELLYSTMLEDALAQCPNGLIVECDKRLKPLFERSFADITFVARSNPPDSYLSDKTITAQCAAGQLGRFFRTSFTDFPRQPNRLRADPLRINELRRAYEHEKIRLGKTGRIIGISWKSKPFVQGDPKSSVLSDWRNLFEQSPHLFVSLQYGDITQDMALAKQNNWPLIVDSAVDQSQSLDDFAAQVCAMDNIVSVSNTTAHMAGGCGIPSAILLTASRGLMWHWFDKESEGSQTALSYSPWYPTLTLLRQEKDGEWQDVMAKAKQFLQQS